MIPRIACASVEAVSHLDAKEREAVETVIASVLHMHYAKRWTQAANAAPVAKTKDKKVADARR